MASKEPVVGGSEEVKPESTDGGLLAQLYEEIVSSPVNLVLLLIILYLLVKILRGYFEAPPAPAPAKPAPPKMKKQDMVLSELRKYDGTQGKQNILLAVNGKIFDVTKGARFYGPGGPYEALAGHDATRAFAKFETDLVKEDYDDFSDLSPSEMSAAKDWEEQLSEKYEFVGKLIKPDEIATNYSDDEGAEAQPKVDAGAGGDYNKKSD